MKYWVCLLTTAGLLAAAPVRLTVVPANPLLFGKGTRQPLLVVGDTRGRLHVDRREGGREADAEQQHRGQQQDGVTQVRVDPQEQAPTAEELKRQQAIAQLAAELRQKKVAYAKRPKVKYLTASTREYAYAAYMRGWSDRVERVGNLNYPEEARRRGLHGDVLLTVVLNLDGSIKSIDVIRSSGQKVLDAAAERIVRLAAPFPPAPRSAERIDELNITRTWRFQPNNVLQTR